MAQVDLEAPLLGPSAPSASVGLACQTCGSPWCRCPAGACLCVAVADAASRKRSAGTFLFRVEGNHTLDPSESSLLERVIKGEEGVLLAISEVLGKFEVKLMGPPEKLESALLRAGIAVTLLSEMVADCSGFAAVSVKNIATFNILGMTCASCVRTVESAIRAVPGVSDASVNLLAHRAEVTFSGVRVQEILDAIDTVGFEVELLNESQVAQSLQTFVANLRVGGMMCASCVATVENIIRDLEGVESVVVNFLTHQAEVSYRRPATLQAIVRSIEGIGFSAELLGDESRAGGEYAFDRPSDLFVELLTGISEATLRIKAAAVVGVEGVVVQKLKTGCPRIARILYKPRKVGARKVLAELHQVCKYSDEVPDDTFADAAQRMFRRFLWALAPTILIVLLAEDLIPMAWEVKEKIPVAYIIIIIMAAFVQFFCGVDFHASALSALRHGAMTMNTLVSLSTMVSFLYGVVVGIYDIFSNEDAPSTMMGAMFCETSAVLICVLLGGRLLEAKAKSKTTTAVRELSAKRPTIAILANESGGRGSEIAYALIEVRDILLVLPGEAVPVDGEVVSDGAAYCDESLLTGESQAVRKEKGSKVFGGSICTQSGFLMRAEGVGNSTTLARIIAMVEDAQTKRPTVQRSVDVVASFFTPIVMSISALTFVIWTLLVVCGCVQYDMSFVVQRTVSVLVIACPCSFGLATPTAVMVATGMAARHGCLVKDAVVWERIPKITHAVFDKTGTLTQGRPQVGALALFPAAKGLLRMAVVKLTAATPAGVTWFEDDAAVPGDVADVCARVGWLVASVEVFSEHPLARALLDWGKCMGAGPPVAVSDFTNIAGEGVTCSVEGVGLVRLGSLDFLGVPDSGEPAGWAQMWQVDGCAVVGLEVAGQLTALLALKDHLQEGAAATVHVLQKQGIQVWMCTGDQKRTALAIAKNASIPPDYVKSQCLPHAKLIFVQELMEHGTVLMVGDGVNDAAALASAAIGVAIGAGSHVTLNSAQVILVRSNLHDLLTFLDFGRATMRTIYRNFAWALSFNAIGIPLAAGAGAYWGVFLPPIFCGVAMASSSIIVVTSSLTLQLSRAFMS